MNAYVITYISTGSQTTQHVTISDRDKIGGITVHNIIGAIGAFEQYAIKWGTHENRNAITNIEVIDLDKYSK